MEAAEFSIFTFWWSGSLWRCCLPAAVRSAVRDWHFQGHSFRVFRNSEARKAVLALGDEALWLYDRIRIPAARSDIARFALLYRYGGCYLDAHVGTANRNRLAFVRDQLSTFEAIFFTRKDPARIEIDVLGSCLCAQPGSTFMQVLFNRAMANLKRHAQAEAETTAHVPYNLAQLTSIGIIISSFFEYDENRVPRLRLEFQDRATAISLDVATDELPFNLYKHYGYRRPSEHWSERQLRERLFF
jgi:hypothetical protein